MGKKAFASSVRDRRRGKSARPMPDSRIDLSDIPEATDEELRRAARGTAGERQRQATDCDPDSAEAARSTEAHGGETVETVPDADSRVAGEGGAKSCIGFWGVGGA